MAPDETPPQTQSDQPGDEHAMHPHPAFMPRFAGSGRLRGRTALITGGDSGIGRAVAVLFAREGANIAIHYKDEHEDARLTRQVVEDEGAECLLMHGDIGDRDTARRAVRETRERFGELNILVNNAAEQHPHKAVEDISPDDLLATFSTNILAQFWLVQAALPGMSRGDCIVNVASVTAYRGSPELLDYAATKGAIVAFTRSLAAKLAKRGIRANCIAPGPIWTPLIPASFDAERVSRHGEDTPMGRVGQPNEVAPCALFLACDDSSYITGQTLHPNGGEPVGG